VSTLRRLDVANFKAFERFTVHLRGDSFLVGPNNAGKSTLIAALRAGTAMLRTARPVS
jgi:predicted ATP-dependent endonuclease of OLD family